SSVPTLIHSFDARHGACREKVAHLDPVIGRTKSKLEHDLAASLRNQAVAPLSAKIARCAPVGLLEGAVEASKAFEACGLRNLGDRKLGLIEQALGEG